MTSGAWILVASVLLAVAFGLWRAATDGRFRGTHRVRGTSPQQHDAGRPHAAQTPAPAAGPTPPPALAALDLAWGERATLLQFSSAFCAPCRATRRVLADVAEAVPGVVYLEIDAEHHLDVVRELGILRTPTTIVYDADGREVTRASGAPRKEQVLAVVSDVPGADAG